MAKDYKYFQFPLCLLAEIIKGRQRGLNLTIYYGFVNYAQKQSFKIREVARQVVHDYYRNRKRMRSILLSKIECAIDREQFTNDEDYNGFTLKKGGEKWSKETEFQPEDNIEEVIELINADSEFKSLAIENYQLHQAADFFKLNIDFDNARQGFTEAKAVQNTFETKYGTDAMPSIKPSVLYEFRDDTKQDINILLAYIGIVSLIGQRHFISTTKPVIVSRMIGCKSKPAYLHYSQDKNISPIVAQFSKRYHIDKLIRTLVERKFIMYLFKPHVSLIYVSKYMEPEELATLVKQSNLRYELQNRIKTASLSI